MEVALQVAKTPCIVADDVAIIQLGRFGDIVHVLPIALHIHNTYRTPYLVVSKEFASILDGISYVKPYVLDIPYGKLVEAITIAKGLFSHVLVPQIYGENWKVAKLTESYNKEMWRLVGMLPRFNSLPGPLFDQRNKRREAAALKRARKTSKPYILVNLTAGHSSPFPKGSYLLKTLQRHWRKVEVLDAGNLGLHRVYDLLGFIEKAAAVITIDTALLHFTAATNTPVIALTNPYPWAGSTPRNETLRLSYSWVNSLMLNDGIRQCLKTVRAPFSPARLVPPLKRQIFHVVALYKESPLPPRKRLARRSWNDMYAYGVIPAHYTKWKRHMAHFGVDSKLPYFKDIINYACEQAYSEDIIVFTNDDIICNRALPSMLHFHCRIWGFVAGRRCEITQENKISLKELPGQWKQKHDASHHGRDTFAFTKEWYKSIESDLPDFLIGSTDWDNALTILMRRACGYETTNKNLQGCIFPAEMELGYTAHYTHKSPWMSFGNFHHSLANIHNRRLFREFAAKYAPGLRFNETDILL